MVELNEGFNKRKLTLLQVWCYVEIITTVVKRYNDEEIV